MTVFFVEYSKMREAIRLPETVTEDQIVGPPIGGL